VGNLGAWEIALIVLVILLVFGPKRLPGIGRSLGRGMREFKESVTDQTRELKEATLITPQEFKDSLNPLKDDPLKDEEPAEAQPAPAAAPVAVVEAAPVAVVEAAPAEPVGVAADGSSDSRPTE
jgi:sec-independent protein translocase protein TatA